MEEEGESPEGKTEAPGPTRPKRHLLWLRRSLTFLSLTVLGILAYWMISTEVQAFIVERTTAAEELVREKPPFEAVLTRNQSFSGKIGSGVLLEGTTVYLFDLSTSHTKSVRLYGWVWTASLAIQGDVARFISDENIRYRADASILGRFNRGAFVKHLYTNDKDSWSLVTADISLPSESLTIVQRSQPSLWRRLRQPQRILSVTSRNGGIVYIYNLFEPLFMVICIAVMIVLSSARVMVSDSTQRTTIQLEIFKSVLQIVVGLVLGFLIFGLGLH